MLLQKNSTGVNKMTAIPFFRKAFTQMVIQPAVFTNSLNNSLGFNLLLRGFIIESMIMWTTLPLFLLILVKPFYMEIVTPDTGLICWTLLCLATVVLYITALVSIFRRSFANPSEARFWLLVVLFFPVIGSILYFRKNKQAAGTSGAATGKSH